MLLPAVLTRRIRESRFIGRPYLGLHRDVDNRKFTASQFVDVGRRVTYNLDAVPPTEYLPPSTAQSLKTLDLVPGRRAWSSPTLRS